MASTALPRRKDARIERSREALHSGLLELIEHHPYDAITIREITDAAGVGYATFYRHFPTKAALLDDVAAEQIRALIGLSLPRPGAALEPREGVRAIVTYVDRHRALWRALLTGGASGTIRAEIIQISREVTPSLQPEGGSAVPADLAHRLCAAGMVEVLAWWLEAGDGISADTAALMLERLVIGPVMQGVG